MLTTLSTVKSRLGLTEFDVKEDAILTNALNAVSARFDKESHRTLARTVGATQTHPCNPRQDPYTRSRYEGSAFNPRKSEPARWP